MMIERNSAFRDGMWALIGRFDRDLTRVEIASRSSIAIQRGRQILKSRGETVVVDHIAEHPFLRVQTPPEIVDFGDRGNCPIWLQRSSKTQSSWQLATMVDGKETVLYRVRGGKVRDGGRSLVKTQLSFANLEKLLDLVSRPS